MYKILEEGDILQKVHINVHTDRKETIIKEYIIDRTTKLYAFVGNFKFKREPIYKGFYRRVDTEESHFISFKLKTK
jgi:hypothetical protein